MIRNSQFFDDWQDKWNAQDKLSLKQKFALVDAMYAEACSLGVFPLKDPLEGIEQKIQFVAALHVRRAA